jgi:aminoglycoside phosphotransferase (APT) family kinase protein
MRRRSDANRQNAIEMGAFPREVQFYRTMAAEVPFAIPHMLYGDFDPVTKDGIILLNKVDGVTRDELSRERNAEFVADATELLTNLAQMHARWWGGDSIPDTGFMVNIEDGDFGHVLDNHDTNLAKLKTRLTKIFPPHTIVKLEQMVRYREPFVSAARAMPRTFCHGDFHAQNILWNPESTAPRARVLDWQMVTVGPGALDVAIYLAIAIPKRPTSTMLMPRIELCHRELIADGVKGYAIEQFIRDYRYAALAALGVMIFALGSLEFIGPSFETIVKKVMGNAIASVEVVNGFDLLS